MKAKNVFLELEVDASVKDALKVVFSTAYPSLAGDKLDVRFSGWLKSLYYREKRVLSVLGVLLFGGSETEVKARAFNLNVAYPEWRCVAIRDLVCEGRWFLVVTERNPKKKLKKAGETDVDEINEAYLGSVIGRDFYEAVSIIEGLKKANGGFDEVNGTSYLAA